ncbi:MAG: hypothetical protein AAGH79_09925 [Bacteroidota bacterium]
MENESNHPEQALRLCSICGTQLQGTFCHQCGQKSTGKRLQFGTIIQDFVSNLLSLERSGFATMIRLLRQPVTVIHNYWAGNRGYYQSPSRIIVYAVLLIGLHIYFHENLIFGLAFTDSPKGFFLVVFLRLFTLSSLIAYPGRHTLAEHIVSVIYLFGTWSVVLLIIFELINLFNPDHLLFNFGVLFSLIAAILFNQARVFLPNAGVGKIILRSFLQFLVLCVLTAVLLLILQSISGIEIEWTYD